LDGETLPPEVSPKYVFSTIYNSTAAVELRILEGATLFGYVVYNGLWLLLYVIVFGMLFVAIIFLSIPNGAPLLGSKADRRRVSAGNFCFALVVFILYFLHYDEKGTNKPGRIEFLG
jgi:hypothetical protein